MHRVPHQGSSITPIEDTFIRGYRQLALETPARSRDTVLRALDIVLSALFLLVALPIALLIALIVGVTSGRPVFYRGERVGRGGRIFTMLKFRTLRSDAETRLGPYLGELVATAGLLMIIVGHRRRRDAPWMVAAWIGEGDS